MSDRNPKELSILLLGVFVVAFVIMKNFTFVAPQTEVDIAQVAKTTSVHIASIAKNRKGYGVASFDAVTGRLDGKRMDLVYRDYDNCLMALFKQRAVLTQASGQQNTRIRCEQTGF